MAEEDKKAEQKENRWVALANKLDWDSLEAKNNEADHKESPYPFRFRLGCQILMYQNQITEGELAKQLKENPYYRYFVGLPMDSEEVELDARKMLGFRKTITLEMPKVAKRITGLKELVELREEKNAHERDVRNLRTELILEKRDLEQEISWLKHTIKDKEDIISLVKKNMTSLEYKCNSLEGYIKTLTKKVENRLLTGGDNNNEEVENLEDVVDLPKVDSSPKKEDLMDISGLTDEQETIFNKAMAGENLFITGGAGTGKSYLLKRLIAHLTSRKKKVVVGAPTGMAALNVGGVTLHRLFGLPIGLVEDIYINAGNVRSLMKNSYDVIHKADVVIIDEISMCRADAFARIANIILYEERAGHHIQVIFCGDFLQLPPVVGLREKEYFSKALHNKEGWAFLSPRWNNLCIKTCHLTKIIRQDNPDFANALNLVREGKPMGLSYICKQTEQNKGTGVMLCGKNAVAQSINEEALASLNEEIVVFNAKVIKNTENLDVEKEIKNITDPHIELCKGARVLVTINDPTGLEKYHNGSMGYVMDIADEFVKVYLDDGNIVGIPRFTYQVYDYKISQDEETGVYALERKVIFSFEQIPLRLGWAITIHKSQGQTYDNMILNTDSLWPMEGLLYVALSRVTSTEGLALVGAHKDQETLSRFLKASQKVRKFYAEIE